MANERIAAIASVAGYRPYRDRLGPVKFDPRISPTTTRPLPLMHIHGTNDPVVPPSRETTIPIGARPTLPALQSVLDAWLANNGCDLVPTIIDLPDQVANDGPSTVQLRHFANCETYTMKLSLPTSCRCPTTFQNLAAGPKATSTATAPFSSQTSCCFPVTSVSRRRQLLLCQLEDGRRGLRVDHSAW